MKEKIHIQFSPTRLKQMKKIALSGSRAKLKILNGKLEEGFHLLKTTAKKFKSFATDLADRIPQTLAARISLDLFSHFERKTSKRLGIPKGIVLGGVLALMCSLPAAGQVFIDAPNTAALDAAIITANGNAADHVIRLDGGKTYTLTASLTTVVNNGTLSVISTGTTNAIIDGATTFRPLTMAINSNLSLSKITVQNGSALSGGGIYNNRGDLTISNSIITNNNASNGGGIYSKGNGGTSSISLQNSIISGNSASNNGGGIWSRYNNTLTVVCSSFTANSSGNKGAGIYNRFNSLIDISYSSISNNISSLYGGGIYNRDNSPLTISSSTISGNRSNSDGAGLMSIINSPLTISKTSILGNIAGQRGGGVRTYKSSMDIESCTIANNQASKGGGLIIFGAAGAPTSTTILNTTISGNTSVTNAGGGIYHNNLGGINSIILQHVTLSDNTGNGGAGTGDGFANRGASNITIQNSIIANSIGAGEDFDLGAASSIIVTASIIETSTSPITSATAIDPLLGALTLNSGFLIHPVKTTSPAINAGTNLLFGFDQVGNTRDGTPHIGAVEVTIPGVCMVVSAPSGVTNTWIGCTNSDWATATNWSSGSVPTASDVVYIPIVAANQLVIDEVATCAKMVVQIGAKCLINYNAGGKLLIKF